MRYSTLLLLGFTSCTSLQMAREVPVPGAAGVGASTGLPCDVQAVLSANCQSCHGAVPAGGAPMSLVTYADLTAPAATDPTQTVAAMCVTRINSTTAPMPPTPPGLSAADIATFTSWVNSGMPMGNCASNGIDPLDAAPTCTSGQTFNGGGDDGSSGMNPGMACISCHSNGEGPAFYVAGTVFPTGHEPDLCVSAAAGQFQVLITDANGTTFTARNGGNGNFFLRPRDAYGFTPPYHAKVVANGMTRAMSAAQTDGDCNGCHTQFGANGAPGRITMP